MAVVTGEATADVVSSGGPAAEMAAKTYAAAVVPIIEESTALLPWLTDVRQHAVKLGRVGVETALGRLVAGADDLEHQLAMLGIPPPSSRSARLFSDVLGTRADAARLVTGGIALAIGPTRDLSGATATLVRAGRELARSDGDYARFGSSLPRYVQQAVPLPASRWDAPAEWTAAALSSFAGLLGTSSGLLIRQSLLIVAISLQPSALRIVGLPTATASTPATSLTTTTTSTTLPPIGTGSTSSTSTTSTTSTTSSTSTTSTTLQVPPAGSISCLQPTSRVSVDVVVANAGNVAASRVEVSATLARLAPPASTPNGSRKRAATARTGRPGPSCGPDFGATGGAGAAGGRAQGGGGAAAATSSQTVTRAVALLSPGTSDDLAMPSMGVRGGSTYLLTVALGRQRESVTLQVASG